MPDLQLSGPKLVSAATAVGDIDVKNWSVLVLNVAMSAATETLSLTYSLDGTNFGATTVRPLDLLTGALFASNTFKAGIFRLDVKGIRTVRVTKSAASETATITTGLGL